MISDKTWAITIWIYDNVHAALWSVLIAGMICFSIFVIPKMPEARAKAEWLRAQETSTEDKFYCEKWGMPQGTHEHNICILDLQRIPANIQKRIDDDTLF
jgi:hypothetical protein